MRQNLRRCSDVVQEQGDKSSGSRGGITAVQQSCQSTEGESLRAPRARTLYEAACVFTSAQLANHPPPSPQVTYNLAILKYAVLNRKRLFPLSWLPRRSDAPPTRHPAPLCRIVPHNWTRRSSSFKDIMKTTLFRKHPPHPSPRRPHTQNTHESEQMPRWQPPLSLPPSPPPLCSQHPPMCATRGPHQPLNLNLPALPVYKYSPNHAGNSWLSEALRVAAEHPPSSYPLHRFSVF